ncbi:MAG: Gfo/Idh/MocA family oxidoreductase [Fuerstiella sp.]|jgi:predicted dehydrogenase|nr:Gfo/Idh/MocA family oxidoreductase [Fuerstiella sp.]
MPEPLRIGVTGSGFMGRTHVDAAHKLESTQPVAVTGGSRAAKLAADYDIDVEPDVQSLVQRSDIDAIVIATPHWVHCDETLAAAAAGKHVLVEKPMATSVADAERMSQACASGGLVLSVGYHQRFRKSNYRTRQLIKEGTIGKVRCIQMSALFDITTMRQDAGFGGNWGWWTDPRSVAHLMNSAPHNIDLCRWWLDSEVVSVAAQSGTFREENPNENTTMTLLTFDDGTMSTFWSSSVLPEPGFTGEAFRFRIMGDDGIIDLDPYGQLQLGNASGMSTVYEQPAVGHDDSASAFALSRMQAYCDQMQGFVNSIRGATGGEGTAIDGMAGVAAVTAMLEASKTNRVVPTER